MPFGGLLTVGLIGAGTSLAGAAIGSHAASKAGKIQAAAAQHVADMATGAASTASAGVNKSTADIDKTLSSTLAPYLTAGTQGITSLADALKPGGSLTQQFSFDPSNIQNDPGYQFQLNEGLKALQRSAAARGELQGGSTLKALMQYGEGLAGTEFENAYRRAANTFQLNRQDNLQSLGLLTGFGQNAANNFANLYANTNQRGAIASGEFGLEGTRIAGEALTGGANAQAAGTVGAANSWNGALGSLGNSAMQLYGLNKFVNPTPAPAPVPTPAPPPITNGPF